MLRKYTFIIGSLLLASCQNNTQQKITDSCVVDGVELKLIQNGNVAVLETGSGSNKVEGIIAMDAPCYFLRYQGNVVTFSYEDIEADNVVAIIGNIADERAKAKEGVPQDAICGNIIQGIVIKSDSRILLTEKTQGDRVVCKDSGLDEMHFWMLSH